MSRHWVYVGVPENIPEWLQDLPPECRTCVYRKSEEANHYCPFPDCYKKVQEDRRKKHDRCGNGEAINIDCCRHLE